MQTTETLMLRYRRACVLAAVAIAPAGCGAQSERVTKLLALQDSQLTLQRKVVEAPDDRPTYRRLLSAILDRAAVLAGPTLTPTDREVLLDLKIVMEDIWSIRDVLSDMRPLSDMSDSVVSRQLNSALVPPARRRRLRMLDPWGTPYRIRVQAANGRFSIVSAGSDRRFDAASDTPPSADYRTEAEVRSANLAADIVFVDGSNFTRIYDYPKSVQVFLYTRCSPADEVVQSMC